MINQIGVDCKLKLMTFGNAIYKESIDYDTLSLVEDPCSRSFHLMKDDKKYLTLTVLEIKTLPNNIQKLFQCIEKDVSNIVFNLISHSFMLLNYLESKELYLI